MNIFSNPDTYNFLVTNHSGHYYGIAGRSIPPKEVVENTPQAQPIRLDKLGINYCQFKREYVEYQDLRDEIDLGNLEMIPLISPGMGVVCEWENFAPVQPTVVNVNCSGGGGGASGGIWQGSGPPSGNEPVWVRPTDGMIFTKVGTKWLSNNIFEYYAGRGFATTNNSSLYSIDSTPTSSAPFIISKDETIVRMKMESGNDLGWEAKVRVYDTLTDLVTGSVPSGSYGEDIPLDVDLNAGVKIEIYVESSAGGIIYPRVKLFTKERVV